MRRVSGEAGGQDHDGAVPAGVLVGELDPVGPADDAGNCHVPILSLPGDGRGPGVALVAPADPARPAHYRGRREPLARGRGRCVSSTWTARANATASAGTGAACGWRTTPTWPPRRRWPPWAAPAPTGAGLPALLELWRLAVRDGGFLTEWARREEPDPGRRGRHQVALLRLRREGVQDLLPDLEIRRAERMGTVLAHFPPELVERAALAAAQRLLRRPDLAAHELAPWLAQAVQVRARSAFVRSLAAWRHRARPAALVPFTCRVGIGVTPAVAGRLDGRASWCEVAVDSRWLLDVWGRGLAVVDGDLVLGADRPGTAELDGPGRRMVHRRPLPSLDAHAGDPPAQPRQPPAPASDRHQLPDPGVVERAGVAGVDHPAGVEHRRSGRPAAARTRRTARRAGSTGRPSG